MSLFAAELIDLNLLATDKHAAIRSLAERAVAAGRGTDVDQIVRDVLARDELGTPQFDRVAIPHARTAGVNEAAVVVARSKSGVGFDPAEPAADVIFLILVPQTAADEHIEILAGLARRLVDPGFTAALRTNSAEEILAVLGTGKGSR